jgi:HAD superfamily hydrolase (TIGR01509 family)
VDSHEVGMRKPSAPIYELTLDRLGMAGKAPRAAFLDDIEANVIGARLVGMHGIHVEADHGPAISTARALAGL